jgi:hypothetical protein
MILWRSPSGCPCCSRRTAGSPPSIRRREWTPTASTSCTCRGAGGCPSWRWSGDRGQSTPIHDHVAWCVVGVYRGVERDDRYRLIEVDGESCLQPSGSVDAHPGHVEALVPPVDDIHAVTAAGDELAISLHVYGADIERLGSSIHRRFDDLHVLAPT